jgi:hypothetical protein
MVPKCLRQNVCAKMSLSKMLGAEMICAKQFFYHIQKLHKYTNSIIVNTLCVLRPRIEYNRLDCWQIHGLSRVVAHYGFPLFLANIYGSSLGWL